MAGKLKGQKPIAKPKAKARSKLPNKSPPKKASPKQVELAATSREQSVSIRKIDNGYITRKSGMVGKGPNARYVEQETFSKAEPKVTIPK